MILATTTKNSKIFDLFIYYYYLIIIIFYHYYLDDFPDCCRRQKWLAQRHHDINMYMDKVLFSHTVSLWPSAVSIVWGVLALQMKFGLTELSAVQTCFASLCRRWPYRGVWRGLSWFSNASKVRHTVCEGFSVVQVLKFEFRQLDWSWALEDLLFPLWSFSALKCPQDTETSPVALT